MDGEGMAGALFAVGFLLVIARALLVANALSSLARSTQARPQAALGMISSAFHSTSTRLLAPTVAHANTRLVPTHASQAVCA